MRATIDTTVVFEPPPAALRAGAPAGSARANWRLAADSLRARPRQWARIASGPAEEYPNLQSLAANILNGRFAAFRPPRSFESIVTLRGQTTQVHARYVGEPALPTLRDALVVDSPVLCQMCAHPLRLHTDIGCHRDCDCVAGAA